MVLVHPVHVTHEFICSYVLASVNFLPNGEVLTSLVDPCIEIIPCL